MIQRIQTVMLLIVIVASVLLLFMPFVSYENLFNTFTLKEYNQPFCSPLYYTAEFLNLFSILLSLWCIFLFKNRPLQFRLANVIALLNICLLLILLFMEPVRVDSFLGGTKHVLWPSYLPIISILSAFLAAVFIRKDEKLVRSADRIR